MNVLLPFKEAGAKKWLFLAAIPIFMAMGCKRVPYICPAYQSAFYLDENFKETTFSQFNEDSMPRIENVVKKNDVLLIAALSKKKTEKRWQTIPMITIFPQPDSALAKAALESGDQMREGMQEEETAGGEQEETQEGGEKKPKELTSDDFYEEEEEDEDEEEEEQVIDELKDLPEEFPTEGEPKQDETEPEKDPAGEPEPEPADEPEKTEQVEEPAEQPEEPEPAEEPEPTEEPEEKEEEEKEPNQ